MKLKINMIVNVDHAHLNVKRVYEGTHSELKDIELTFVDEFYDLVMPWCDGVETFTEKLHALSNPENKIYFAMNIKSFLDVEWERQSL